MRTLGIIFSVVVHLGLVYWLFNTQVPTGMLKVPQNENIIEVRPIPPFDRVYYRPDKPPPEKEIIFRDPSTSTVGDTTTTPAQPKESETEEHAGPQDPGAPPGTPFPQFSLGAADLPLLQGKPDFLIGPGRGKLIANPFVKGIPKETAGLWDFYYPFIEITPGSRLALRFPTRPPPGSRMGGSGKKRFYKGKKASINFNVKGLNISPWAKKVVTKIQEHWQLPPSLASSPNLSLAVGVKIVIDKSGSLSSAEIKKSSLVEEVDQAVLTALNLSAPFPKLPEGFPKQTLEAYLWFNVDNNDTF
jgi:TonB family protein